MLRAVLEPNAAVSEFELRSFAKRHGIKLPKPYEEFLLNTNGGQPVPSVFPIIGLENNPKGVIQAFFALKASIETEDLETNLSGLEGSVPRGVLPVATTDGNDWIILDLRKPHAPVFFWDRKPFWGNNVWNEDDLHFVASSFDSLLSSLSDL